MQIKCPKCKNTCFLYQAQIDELNAGREVLCSCSVCKHFFHYKIEKRYKRPIKFMFFSIFGIGRPLNDGDAVLNNSSYHYNAAQHCVRERVVIPNGPQGYVQYKIPEKIKTHEELGAYLKNKYGFNCGNDL